MGLNLGDQSELSQEERHKFGAELKDEPDMRVGTRLRLRQRSRSRSKSGSGLDLGLVGSRLSLSWRN